MNKLFILGLCIVCFAMYVNNLNSSFVLDDYTLIVDNSLVKSPGSTRLIFTQSLNESTKDKFYRPLQILTYALDYKMWGLSLFGFHLVNIIIHLFNFILVYYLLFSLFNNSTLSTAVSALFLVHPVQISAVSYISGRADLLVSFFMLSSMILLIKFIKQKSVNYYLVSLLCAILALFSRENALLLPLFVALVLFALKTKTKYYLLATPFILLDLIYLLLRFILFGQYAFSLHPALISLNLRILNFFNIIIRYLAVLILPLDLHMFRSTPFIFNFFEIRSILVLIFILFLIVVLIKFRKNKQVLFGFFWFFIGLIPVSIFLDGYVDIGKAVMAESWLYLPCIGFFALLINTRIIFKRLSKPLLFCVLFFYVALTMLNNAYWNNRLIFYKNILTYEPEANRVRKGLISAYLQYGLYDEAFNEIQEFSRYDSAGPDLYFLMANYYLLTGKTETAIHNYNLALPARKDFKIYYNLSICYENLKQLDKAIDSAMKCLKINPYYSPAFIKLGDLYFEEKQFKKSIDYYRKAFQLDPKNKILKDRIDKVGASI